MKITKLFLPFFVIISLIFMSNISKADDGVHIYTRETFPEKSEISKSKVSSLSYQIVEEIKANLKKPFLLFKDKNLKGDVFLTVKVSKNGKIKFPKVEGENKVLNKSVVEKLNSLNLWTGTNAAGLTFNYKISFSQ